VAWLRISLSLFWLVGQVVSQNAIQRLGHSAVVLPNQSILIFGGYDFIDINWSALQYEGLKNDLLLITAMDGTGTISKVYPSSTSALPKARMFHVASFAAHAGAAGQLWVQGGSPLNFYAVERSTIYRACAMNDMWAFDIANLTWSRIWPQSDSELQDCRGSRLSWAFSGLFLSLVALRVGAVL